MIDIEMINEIIKWGFIIDKEYHRTRAHDGIIGIKDKIITETDVLEIWSINAEYLDITFTETLERLETQPVYIGDYKIYTTYKLYNEDAIELTTFSDYLGDNFEEYLRDNGIQVYDYDNSDIEEFFEQYGIEVY